jgi:spore maturation protein CgeB
MNAKYKFRFFAHSWVSDWNHGNAHFLRGLARELTRMGHEVRCYEELGSWSLTNLVNHEGTTAISAIDDFRRTYPELNIHFYQRGPSFEEFLDQELKGADFVVIHEWNDPEVVNAILQRKQKEGFLALLHDTHHRVYSRAHEILKFHLHRFDGVLAFGEVIRKIYQDGLGIERAWTFHEAADVSVFNPQGNGAKTTDVVWIGNWGDEERTKELTEFLIGPASASKGRKIVAHGVRYPDEAVGALQRAGIDFRGYLPNLETPRVYGQSRLALHVPRRQYSNGLSGIPTIRVFEALACGIPLLCSPWNDIEHLFRPGEDYIVAADGKQMAGEIDILLRDHRARGEMAANGLETIRKRHTCAHRAAQLLEICEEVRR